jgi:HEAT repeat protein
MTENRYAILIAGSKYQDRKLSELKCPANDIKGLDQVLKDYCSFPEPLLLNDSPNCDILQHIERIIKKSQKNDLVLIYYSGHGILDAAGRLYLTTVNTIVDYPYSTSIPIESIKSIVEVSTTNRVILILDCCYSGAAGTSFTRGGIDNQLQLLSGARGTYILTASTEIQLAFEQTLVGYGVFTRHLIEGISSFNAANEEGNITMDSLYSYVYQKMAGEGFQRPMKWSLKIEGELIIASGGRPKRLETLEFFEKALDDENILMRKVAVDLLGTLSDSNTVRPLIKALRDKNSDVWVKAADALTRIGRPAVFSLIQSLKDEDLILQRKAVDVLEGIGEPATRPLIEALNDGDINVKINAIEALGNIGDNRAVGPLINILMDDDPNVRAAATKALGIIGDSGAVDQLINALMNDKKIQTIAAKALVRIGKKSIEPLIQALKIADNKTQMLIAESLVEIGEYAVEPLIHALADQDCGIRAIVYTALGKIKDIRAVEPLIIALRDDHDIRAIAAKALGNIGYDSAVEPLIAALRYEDSNVKINAAEALGIIGNPEATEPLIQVLQGEDNNDVRATAAEALGNIRVKEALYPLWQALRDNDPEVRNKAWDALRKNDVNPTEDLFEE